LSEWHAAVTQSRAVWRLNQTFRLRVLVADSI
jgi:hypothetical protein